ncbi:MAG: hypothetical protein ACOC4B_02700 [Bacteroidota bacterium]
MVIISRQNIAGMLLMEEYARLHELEEKEKTFIKQYNSFNDLEAKVKEKENFVEYDDYIEWKAIINHLQFTKTKIREIKSGKFQIS